MLLCYILVCCIIPFGCELFAMYDSCTKGQKSWLMMEHLHYCHPLHDYSHLWLNLYWCVKSMANALCHLIRFHNPPWHGSELRPLLCRCRNRSSQDGWLPQDNTVRKEKGQSTNPRESCARITHWLCFLLCSEGINYSRDILKVYGNGIQSWLT